MLMGHVGGMDTTTQQQKAHSRHVRVDLVIALGLLTVVVAAKLLSQVVNVGIANPFSAL